MGAAASVGFVATATGGVTSFAIGFAATGLINFGATDKDATGLGEIGGFVGLNSIGFIFPFGTNGNDATVFGTGVAITVDDFDEIGGFVGLNSIGFTFPFGADGNDATVFGAGVAITVDGFDEALAIGRGFGGA
jgi:hypothetical protein